MNADELKLITDMISLLSVQGKEAFVWFLALKYGAPLLLHLVLWPCAFVVIIKIVQILNRANVYESNLRVRENVYESNLRVIRTILFPNYFGNITNGELDQILKKIQFYKQNDSSC